MRFFLVISLLVLLAGCTGKWRPAMSNVSKYENNPEAKSMYMRAFGNGFKKGWAMLYIWSGAETNIPIRLQPAYYDGTEDGYHAGLSARSNYEPKLGRLIAKADRITVSQYGISLTISGEQAKQIVKAASKAMPIGHTQGMFETELQFYRGTSFITKIFIQDGDFVFQQQEYSDDSGVLRRFYYSEVTSLMLEKHNLK